METRNKCLRKQIAALRGTRSLAVYCILSRLLRSVRLVLHPKLCIYKSALVKLLIFNS